MPVPRSLFILTVGLLSLAGHTRTPCQEYVDTGASSPFPPIMLAEGVQREIAPPLLAAVPDQTAAREAVEQLSGKLGWERFLRESVMAPVMIDIDYIQTAEGRRIGHSIHSAFVAHTELTKLRDEELMQQMFGESRDEAAQDGVVIREIDEAALAALGIEADGEQQRYAYIELPLLNRVRVQGVLRIDRIEREDGYELWWRLDPRFAESTTYGNRWSKLERNEVGKLQAGPPQPYGGMAGMISAYEIPGEPHAVLIESRMLLHEPAEWFGGSNFLRSKLPLSIQENARQFRRKL